MQFISYQPPPPPPPPPTHTQILCTRLLAAQKELRPCCPHSPVVCLQAAYTCHYEEADLNQVAIFVAWSLSWYREGQGCTTSQARERGLWLCQTEPKLRDEPLIVAFVQSVRF